MTTPTDPLPPPIEENHAPSSRIAFERLRERTDELELIVSGLLAFALLTVPGRIFDSWSANAVHVEGVFEYALRFGVLIASGLSYALAFAFIVHLAIRGYWIGLIGLKSTFPAGIRWDRLPLMGVVTRPFYQSRVSDLGQAIDRADRAASMLFAMAILLALSMMWIGILAVAMILIAGLFGSLFSDTERITRLVLLIVYFSFIASTMLPVVIERYVARRQRFGKRSPQAEAIARGLLRVLGFIVPQRLIMPVQLTLQSNLPSRGFMAVYFVVLMTATAIGGVQVANSVNFSLVNSYGVLTTEAIDHGMSSAHYESMRSEQDRLLRYPMIPSDRVAETHLRLFIPHLPQRDNALARKTCPPLPDGNNAASGEAAADLAQACLASFWTVTLDGNAIALDEFIVAERRDVGMRGLIGYLPIGDLASGRHDLRLAWNAAGGDTGKLRRRDYRIPFWLSPGIEQGAAAN